MKISIIIPCYNVNDAFFKDCLLSIKKQTFNDYELIIIDDGSDATHASATKETLGSIVPNGRYYYQENQGVSAARNNAVKYAQGDYICFIDADDTVMPEFLEEAYRIAKTTNADLVIGGNRVYNNNLPINEKKLSYSLLSPSQKERFKANMIGTIKHFGSQNGYFGRGSWNRLVRRNYVLQTPFDEKLKIGEDIVWNLQLLDKIDNVVIVQRVWYLYRSNEASATKKPNKDAIRIAEDELNAIAQYIDLDNDIFYSSYCERIIQDLQRVYQTYICNKELSISPYDKKCAKKRIKKMPPWTKLRSFRAIRVLRSKLRIKCLLALSGGFYYYYRLKQKRS